MPALQCNDEKGKKSIIIMIPKPGKDHTAASSDRPISLCYYVYAMNFMHSPKHEIIIAPVYTTQTNS